VPSGLSGDTHLDFTMKWMQSTVVECLPKAHEKNHGSARLLEQNSFFGHRKPETETSGTWLSQRLEELEIFPRTTFRRPSPHLERFQKVKF